VAHNAISRSRFAAVPSPDRQDAGRDWLAQVWPHSWIVPAAIGNSR
jgi:hypothetical protein